MSLPWSSRFVELSTSAFSNPCAAAGVKGGHADPHLGRYLAIYQAFAARLMELQGADGAWRSSLLQSDLFPTPETSATACFTHGLAYMESTLASWRRVSSHRR